MSDVTNVIVYKEDWATRLQERLSEPNKWKEICNVEYTNTRTLNNPYLLDPTVQTLTRGCAYAYQIISEVNETVTISTGKIIPQLIDRGDLAQSGYMKQMEAADRQAVLLNEAIETGVYAAHAGWTDFDNASIGGSAGNITVSLTNIDDIIRGVKREIREANGETLLNQNGGFIVWRPADFEILEALMQANGYMTADMALRNGSTQGVRYMGMDHYSSNLLATGHLFGGVKKVLHLGILRETYGQIMVDEKDPGQFSGISIVSRVDYGVKAWTKTKTVLLDILVA